VVKHRSFIRKYKVPLSLASFVFIGIPTYIDTLWSLTERISNMNEAGFNVAWLYAVTIPIGLAMFIFIIWQSRKPLENSDAAWQVYDELVNAFRELVFAKDEKLRVAVHTRIESERGKLPDKQLDKYINLFLAAEAERARYNIDPYSDEAQYVLSLNNERMRNHIKSRYGERRIGTSSS
jgi:hypothetical protein